MFNIRLTPVIKNLLIINVLLYFVDVVIFETEIIDPYLFRVNMYGFNPLSEYFKLWQPITSMFMHADTTHLFMNMIGLFFFGPQIESDWGSKKFLKYYFFTGIGAFLTHFAVYALTGTDGVILGASGAIYGVLLAYGMSYPNRTLILLFPPIPIKAKYLIMILIAIELFSGVTGQLEGIAHFAHLGGMLFGFILIKFWQKQQEHKTRHF